MKTKKKKIIIIISIVAAASILIALIGCSRMSVTLGAKVDYGSSGIYSQKDMKAAVRALKNGFRSKFTGCRLISVSYTSDSCNSASNVSWMNELGSVRYDEKFTRCICFKIVYRTGMFSNGSTGADTENEISCYLARSGGGRWRMMTWGVV